MEVNLTYSFKEFEKLNTPIYHSRGLHNTMYPQFLKFNKTYYLLNDKQLTAFRILAISFEKSGFSTYMYCFVQLPNQEPKWVKQFITKNSIVFANKDDMFEYLKGNQNVNINTKWGYISHFLLHNKNYKFDADYYEGEWVWDSCEKCPVKNWTIFEHILITEGKVNFSILIDSCAYPTKEECLKSQLDGFVIDDFMEEPTKIELTILPNKAKTHILKFVEE